MEKHTWAEVSASYQKDWEQNRKKVLSKWEHYEPAYRFGWETRTDPRNYGRSWKDVKAELERAWGASDQSKPWNQISEYVRSMWEPIPTESEEPSWSLEEVRRSQEQMHRNPEVDASVQSLPTERALASEGEPLKKEADSAKTRVPGRGPDETVAALTTGPTVRLPVTGQVEPLEKE